MPLPLTHETTPRRRFTLPKPFAIIVLIALCIIPLLYAATLIWANDDPTGNIDRVPAAIVNEDAGTSIKSSDGTEKSIHLGKEVVDALVDANGDSKKGFDWTITDARTASAGLADGTYLAVLTVPESFSANATSAAASDPQDAASATQGVLQIATNDATNFITGNIAATLGKTISDNLDEKVSADYLENVYLGFTDIHDSISNASDGAGSLADGTTTLASGAADLNSGLLEMESATSALPGGASTLSSGIADAHTGAKSLSTGLERLRTGTDTLADSAGTALTGAKTLSSGLTSLKSGTSSLADGAGTALTGAQTLSSGLKDLESKTPDLADGASGVSDRLNSLVAGYDSLTDEQRKAALAQLAGGAQTVADGTQSLNENVPKLAAGSTALVGSSADGTGLAALVDGAAEVRDGASSAADGASSLKKGLRKLAKGATKVHDGTATAADGASSLNAGLGKLADGAGEMTTKLTTLTGSISSAASGSSKVADGAGSVKDGADKLADGLATGLDKIPAYTDTQASDLAGTAAAPVTLKDVREHEVANYGTGLTPYFLSLGLWVGALAVFFMRPALNAGLLRSRTPFPLIALRSYLPNALIALIQSALAVTVVHTFVGINMADLPGVYLLAALASLTFMAINQALIALLGAPGRFVGLLFVVMQLAAAGGTYPIYTAAPFFQALHDWLPLTDAVQSFRTLIAGGGLNIGGWVWSLAIWLVVGLLATMVAAFIGQRRASRAAAEHDSGDDDESDISHSRPLHLREV